MNVIKNMNGQLFSYFYHQELYILLNFINFSTGFKRLLCLSVCANNLLNVYAMLNFRIFLADSLILIFGISVAEDSDEYNTYI